MDQHHFDHIFISGRVDGVVFIGDIQICIAVFDNFHHTLYGDGLFLPAFGIDRVGPCDVGLVGVGFFAGDISFHQGLVTGDTICLFGRGGHDIILFDIDAGIHFDQARVIFEDHDISRHSVYQNQGREAGAVAFFLDFTLCRAHGGKLVRAGAADVTGLAGTFIAHDKADIGAVPVDRGDAGVDPDIGAFGNIAEIRGPYRIIIPAHGRDSAAVLLSDDGVDITLSQLGIVIILLADKIAGEDDICPVRDLRDTAFLHFAGHGID